MGTLIDVNARRLAKVYYADAPRAGLPAGCRGAACPAFAICQGQCATDREAQRTHPDGGVWIEPRG